MTMTEPATPTPAAPAAPVKASSNDMAAKLNAMREPAPAAPPAPAAAPVTEAPPLPPVELPSREKTKLAQLNDALTRAEKATLEHKAAVETERQRAAALEAKLAEFDASKGDINKLLRYGKVTPEQLGKLFLEGKLNFQPEPEPPVAPEFPADVKEALEYAKQAKTREERDAQAREAAAARAADVQDIGERLSKVADQHPVLAALPNVAERLLDTMLAEAGDDGELPDFAAVVERAEKAVLAEIKTLVSSDAALKALVADEDTRTRLTALLGVAAPAKGTPSTLTNRATSAVPSQSRKASSSAELAARIEQLKGGA